MRVVSINLGRPRQVRWRGKTVRTSIFKEPVSGPVRVHRLNLEGDEQADLSVHGGAEKAVYAYPSEHYSYWRSQFPEIQVAWGAFGENLTTEGLNEGSLFIGSRLSIGSGEFIVTQPRLPCFKLGIRFGRPDMVKLFQKSARSGFYLAVLQEGLISPGDPIRVHPETQSGLTVEEVLHLYASDTADQDLLRRATDADALPESWRQYFRNRLRKRDA